MSDDRYVGGGFGLKQVIGGQVVHDYASTLVDRMREEEPRLTASDLTFHLAQAGLSFRCFREIARLLRERVGE